MVKSSPTEVELTVKHGLDKRKHERRDYLEVIRMLLAAGANPFAGARSGSAYHLTLELKLTWPADVFADLIECPAITAELAAHDTAIAKARGVDDDGSAADKTSQKVMNLEPDSLMQVAARSTSWFQLVCRALFRNSRAEHVKALKSAYIWPFEISVRRWHKQSPIMIITATRRARVYT